MPVNQSRDFEIVENRALERFRKISPPKFFGGSDPEVTENWLKKMINIFTGLNYTEERHVSSVVFQFEGQPNMVERYQG